MGAEALAEELRLSDYKGVGLLFVRTLARAKGPATEASLLAQLAPLDVGRYQALVATEWVPIDFANRLYEAAAPLLYPGKSQPLRLLGRDLAKDNLKGVYRFVARVLTIPFLMDQSGLLWRTYHRNGKCSVAQRTGSSLDFLIADYPRLPERFRECICGYLAGAAETAGARNVTVVKFDDDANAWRWNLRWS